MQYSDRAQPTHQAIELQAMRPRAGTGRETATAGPGPLRMEAPRRVLIADNAPACVAMLRVGVEALGLQHDVARDGMETLEKLAAQDFDLLLLDHDMPHLNGLQVMCLHNLERRPPRVLAMIPDAAPWLEGAFRAAGCQSCLRKPFAMPTLLNVLRDIAGASASAG
jgi:CheY-like chemotaxis protein